MLLPLPLPVLPPPSWVPSGIEQQQYPALYDQVLPEPPHRAVCCCDAALPLLLKSTQLHKLNAFLLLLLLVLLLLLLCLAAAGAGQVSNVQHQFAAASVAHGPLNPCRTHMVTCWRPLLEGCSVLLLLLCCLCF